MKTHQLLMGSVLDDDGVCPTKTATTCLALHLLQAMISSGCVVHGSSCWSRVFFSLLLQLGGGEARGSSKEITKFFFFLAGCSLVWSRKRDVLQLHKQSQTKKGNEWKRRKLTSLAFLGTNAWPALLQRRSIITRKNMCTILNLRKQRNHHYIRELHRFLLNQRSNYGCVFKVRRELGQACREYSH